ncbi:MAG TPA: alpha-(1-_3)-arabinofuranosyltransferase family protein, partial [Solirubrobacteraceae bacterium]|nr:alpha-(1->3)-arabinofuranosyltransferase family protein [Solirubrobacteraceae bacterium]
MGPRLIPLGLAAASYVLALVQRPGTVVADTKVDLYVDAGSFLGDVAYAWTPTGQLGHVFGGQYGGYLFPMAPWFALGDLLGLPTWVVHRLWLGTLMALAAWGVVRLLDDLLDRPRGAPHVAAAVLFVLNPYVAVYANRISVSLLAYAALPWLLLAIHRGLRQPRTWRWPALFALVLTCTGGGVNVAVTGWLLLAPALFLIYERTLGGVPKGSIRPFLIRLASAVALANAWWVLPVLVHARYGLDFLPFTEQPGTIWQTTSVTEALRLMSFWTSYIGLGFGGTLRPYASHGPDMLFSPLVVVASLLIPAIALGGFARTRRWRYGPWFLILTLVGLLAMFAGFPEGTPLRRALTFTYNHVGVVQFLRTTYKAGPLVALGLSCLGGAAFGLLWARTRGAARAGVSVAAAAVVAVAAWPLPSGQAPERQLAFDVPRYWEDAAARVDRLPENERAMVLPGQLFAFYEWGGTWDPILQTLADRPVAERWVVPFSDLRAVDLMWATDSLVSQERLVNDQQLAQLLDLMGVGMVVTPADTDRSRSGAIGPVEAGDVLGHSGG